MGRHSLLPVLGAQGPAGALPGALPGGAGAGSRGRIQGQDPGGFLAHTRNEREARELPDEGDEGSGSCSGSD